jgi:hypothetical protein
MLFIEVFMADENKVDTRIPLTLHPAVFAARIPVDHHGDHAINQLQSAHATARRSLETTLASHSAIIADPTFTPVRNLQRSGEAAERRKADALAAIDEAVKRAHVSLEGIADTMAKAVEGPSSSTVEAVASRLAEKSPEERRKIISAALQADDKITLAGIFRLPAWMSGLSDAERDLYRAQYQRAKFPDLIARKAAIEAAIELSMDAGTALCKTIHELVDAKAVADAMKAAAAAELALKD